MAKVKFDVYEEVTAQIVAALEKGVKPWECPWEKDAAGMPLRSTGEAYRGINSLLLSLKAWEKGYKSATWMTFNQAKNFGGKVKKGEKSALVVKYGTFEKEAEGAADDQTITCGYLKSYRVFNAEQIEGIDELFPVREAAKPLDTRPIEHLSHMSANMIEALGVEYGEGGSRAFYSPSLDMVQMPEISSFHDAERFYATLFHELIHATGHADRCDRTTEKKGAKFGNAAYAKEELCAEIGSAMLGMQVGFKPGHIEDSAAYVESWLQVLKSDKRAIIRASAAAQKAADYLMAAAQARPQEVAA